MRKRGNSSWSWGSELPLLRGEDSNARGQTAGGKELEMNKTATLETTRVAMHSITAVGILRLGCAGQRAQGDGDYVRYSVHQ
jgi:hypothetical protein